MEPVPSQSMRGVVRLVLLLAIQASVWAGEAAARTAPTVLGPGISVDVKQREARMDATVCLRRGILEYLVCKARTFEHESIFATNAIPSQLHTALLLIGADPFPFILDDEWSLQARKHPTARLAIEVEYDHQGEHRRRRISDFMVNRERQDALADDRWIFSGSAFYQRDGKEYYAADSAGGVIGLTPKGASVIQYGEKIGVPYHGEDQGMASNESLLPPVGTAVTLIFRLHGAPHQGEAEAAQSRPAGTATP